MPPPPPLLSTSSFQKTLSSYIHRNKDIDPIAKSQLESLTLEWVPEPEKKERRRTAVHHPNDDEDDDDDDDGGGCNEEKSDHHGCRIEGTLRLSNEYVVLSLRSVCQWELWKPLSATTTSSATIVVANGDVNTTEVCGTMTFHLYASVAPKRHDRDDGVANVIDRKQQRRRDKIQKGILKRMKEDAYIRCLMVEDEEEGKQRRFSRNVPSNSPTSAKDEETFGQLLFEGSVRNGHAPSDDDDHGLDTTIVGPNRLEERVYVSDAVLEGVRRSLFSSLTSRQDGVRSVGVGVGVGDGDDEINDGSKRHGAVAVVQLLLDMPYIPRPHTSLDFHAPPRSSNKEGVSNNNEEMVGFNYLAERVALRLLEDVTLDACEKEDEAEMLNDLTLSEEDGAVVPKAGENSSSHEKEGKKETNTENRNENWNQIPIRKKDRMRKH